MDQFKLRIRMNEFIGSLLGSFAGNKTVIIYNNYAAGNCTIGKKFQAKLSCRINIDIDMYHTKIRNLFYVFRSLQKVTLIYDYIR